MLDLGPISVFNAKLAMEMECQQVLDGDNVHAAMIRYDGNLKRVHEVFEREFESQVESGWDRLKIAVNTAKRGSAGGTMPGLSPRINKTPSSAPPSHRRIRADSSGSGGISSDRKRSSSWDRSPRGAMNQYTHCATEEQNLMQLIAVIGPRMCDEDSLTATLTQGEQDRIPFIISLSNVMTRSVRRQARQGIEKAALAVLGSLLAKSIVVYDPEGLLTFADRRVSETAYTSCLQKDRRAVHALCFKVANARMADFAELAVSFQAVETKVGGNAEGDSIGTSTTKVTAKTYRAYNVLARHAISAGGLQQQSLNCSIQAATAGLQLGMYVEAAEHYGNAVNVLEAQLAGTGEIAKDQLLVAWLSTKKALAHFKGAQYDEAFVAVSGACQMRGLLNKKFENSRGSLLVSSLIKSQEGIAATVHKKWYHRFLCGCGSKVGVAPEFYGSGGFGFGGSGSISRISSGSGRYPTPNRRIITQRSASSGRRVSNLQSLDGAGTMMFGDVLNPTDVFVIKVFRLVRTFLRDRAACKNALTKAQQKAQQTFEGEDEDILSDVLLRMDDVIDMAAPMDLQVEFDKFAAISPLESTAGELPEEPVTPTFLQRTNSGNNIASPRKAWSSVTNSDEMSGGLNAITELRNRHRLDDAEAALNRVQDQVNVRTARAKEELDRLPELLRASEASEDSDGGTPTGSGILNSGLLATMSANPRTGSQRTGSMTKHASSGGTRSARGLLAEKPVSTGSSQIRKRTSM